MKSVTREIAYLRDYLDGTPLQYHQAEDILDSLLTLQRLTELITGCVSYGLGSGDETRAKARRYDQIVRTADNEGVLG